MNQTLSSFGINKESDICKINGFKFSVKSSYFPSYLINSKSQNLNINVVQDKPQWEWTES